jgi:hypothetical protein
MPAGRAFVSIEADPDPPVALSIEFVPETAPVVLPPDNPPPDPVAAVDRPSWPVAVSSVDLGWLAGGLVAGIALRRRLGN